MNDSTATSGGAPSATVADAASVPPVSATPMPNALYLARCDAVLDIVTCLLQADEGMLCRTEKEDHRSGPISTSHPREQTQRSSTHDTHRPSDRGQRPTESPTRGRGMGSAEVDHHYADVSVLTLLELKERMEWLVAKEHSKDFRWEGVKKAPLSANSTTSALNLSGVGASRHATPTQPGGVALPGGSRCPTPEPPALDKQRMSFRHRWDDLLTSQAALLLATRPAAVLPSADEASPLSLDSDGYRPGVTSPAAEGSDAPPQLHITEASWFAGMESIAHSFIPADLDAWQRRHCGRAFPMPLMAELTVPPGTMAPHTLPALPTTLAGSTAAAMTSFHGQSRSERIYLPVMLRDAVHQQCLRIMEDGHAARLTQYAPTSLYPPGPVPWPLPTRQPGATMQRREWYVMSPPPCIETSLPPPPVATDRCDDSRRGSIPQLVHSRLGSNRTTAAGSDGVGGLSNVGGDDDVYSMDADLREGEPGYRDSGRGTGLFRPWDLPIWTFPRSKGATAVHVDPSHMLQGAMAPRPTSIAGSPWTLPTQHLFRSRPSMDAVYAGLMLLWRYIIMAPYRCPREPPSPAVMSHAAGAATLGQVIPPLVHTPTSTGGPPSSSAYVPQEPTSPPSQDGNRLPAIKSPSFSARPPPTRRPSAGPMSLPRPLRGKSTETMGTSPLSGTAAVEVTSPSSSFTVAPPTTANGEGEKRPSFRSGALSVSVLGASGEASGLLPAGGNSPGGIGKTSTAAVLPRAPTPGLATSISSPPSLQAEASCSVVDPHNDSTGPDGSPMTLPGPMATKQRGPGSMKKYGSEILESRHSTPVALDVSLVDSAVPLSTILVECVRLMQVRLDGASGPMEVHVLDSRVLQRHGFAKPPGTMFPSPCPGEVVKITMGVKPPAPPPPPPARGNGLLFSSAGGTESNASSGTHGGVPTLPLQWTDPAAPPPAAPPALYLSDDDALLQQQVQSHILMSVGCQVDTITPTTFLDLGAEWMAIEHDWWWECLSMSVPPPPATQEEASPVTSDYIPVHPGEVIQRLSRSLQVLLPSVHRMLQCEDSGSHRCLDCVTVIVAVEAGDTSPQREANEFWHLSEVFVSLETLRPWMLMQPSRHALDDWKRLAWLEAHAASGRIAFSPATTSSNREAPGGPRAGSVPAPFPAFISLPLTSVLGSLQPHLQLGGLPAPDAAGCTARRETAEQLRPSLFNALEFGALFFRQRCHAALKRWTAMGAAAGGVIVLPPSLLAALCWLRALGDVILPHCRVEWLGQTQTELLAAEVIPAVLRDMKQITTSSVINQVSEAVVNERLHRFHAVSERLFVRWEHLVQRAESVVHRYVLPGGSPHAGALGPVEGASKYASSLAAARIQLAHATVRYIMDDVFQLHPSVPRPT